MKLIGLMSLTQYRNEVRKVFEKHEIQIYSEVEITGHTPDTIRKYGWWVFDEEVPIYSTMYFTVVSKEKAASILNDILQKKDSFDSEHPPRAFQIAVEKMI